MNKLDDKVIIRKSHLAALCGMLNPLNQNQDRVASEVIRLLDQDLTGWAAVPVKPTEKMAFVGADCLPDSVCEWEACALDTYRAMIEASPPLPVGEE